ncbi:hypothetical protein BML2526_13600 [Providencia rettgeri]|nr:hypothetical protein BML2526_13600 [Providencia rettgeri]BBV02442.1 hypothetical protein BML2531_02180 [Providencia rettgeri]BBV10786.1 hypothetical protein BML2576_02450 [Providencia rettgeri]BDH16910.1 hypothetical protein PrNR1418_02010 [Providencia rettgeri]
MLFTRGKRGFRAKKKKTPVRWGTMVGKGTNEHDGSWDYHHEGNYLINKALIEHYVAQSL